MIPRAVVGLAFAACTSPSAPGDTGASRSMVLLDPSALVPVSAADDPLSAHRPANVDCPPGAWGEEGGGFEVQTGVCAYAAFEQPLDVVPAEGDLIEVSIWHDSLDAVEPATGHVAVLLDDRVVWEQTVDIPAASAALEALVPVDFAPSADAHLGLHLHNHGYNSWRFVQVVAITP